MGDTGSMFFGGIVTALAFVMQRPELVLFFGIVYIWDAMTVVIQRTYFKATHGKRLFKMAPIHHHFEMWRLGREENRAGIHRHHGCAVPAGLPCALAPLF